MDDRSWSVAADLLHSAGPVLSVAHVRLSPGVSSATAAECSTTSAPELEATDNSSEAGFSVAAAGPNSCTSAAQQERPEVRTNGMYQHIYENCVYDELKAIKCPRTGFLCSLFGKGFKDTPQSQQCNLAGYSYTSSRKNR